MSKQEKDKGPKLENKNEPKKKISLEELAKILEQNGLELDISSFQGKKDIKERVKDQVAQSSKVVEAMPPSSYDTVTEVAPPRPSTPPRTVPEETGVCKSPTPRYVEIKQEVSDPEPKSRYLEGEDSNRIMSREDESAQQLQLLGQQVNDLSVGQSEIKALLFTNKNNAVVERNESAVMINSDQFIGLLNSHNQLMEQQNSLIAENTQLRRYIIKTDETLNRIESKQNTGLEMIWCIGQHAERIEQNTNTLMTQIATFGTVLSGFTMGNQELVNNLITQSISQLENNIQKMEEIPSFEDTTIRDEMYNYYITENYNKNDAEIAAQINSEKYTEAMRNIIFRIHDLIGNNPSTNDQKIYEALISDELYRDYMNFILDEDKKIRRDIKNQKDYFKKILGQARATAPQRKRMIEYNEQQVNNLRGMQTMYNNYMNQQTHNYSIINEIVNSYENISTSGVLQIGPIEYLTAALEQTDIRGLDAKDVMLMSIQTQINQNGQSFPIQYIVGDKMNRIYNNAINQRKTTFNQTTPTQEIKKAKGSLADMFRSDRTLQ